jgi:hypothetical protein
MQPNKVLSKSMHVRPLAKDEVVIYQLIESTKLSPNAVDDETGEKKMNSPKWKSARQTMVRDFETGESVVIGCVVGQKPVTIKEGPNRGQIFNEDVLSVLKFDNGGFLKLSASDFGMYQYAERHSANESNPFRDASKQAKYFRLDPKRKAVGDSQNLTMKGDALAWIGTCDHIEIKAINESLPDGYKLNMESDYEVIKAQLLKLTDNDPIMVMKASNNKRAIVKITVMECEKFQIILWEENKREWFYNDDKMETLAKIEIGKNRYDGMVEFFKSNEKGPQAYKRLETKLRKFLNMGAPN